MGPRRTLTRVLPPSPQQAIETAAMLKTSGAQKYCSDRVVCVIGAGHPHIKIVGMTAGDEESYETFKELFDPVISARSRSCLFHPHRSR